MVKSITQIHRIVLVIWIFIVATNASAQNTWQILPDSGLLINGSRFEDVYFTNLTTGYAVTLRGQIFRTKDAGRNWSVVLNKPQEAYFRSIEFLQDKKTGLAGCLDSGNVYLTEDGGDTWTNIYQSIPDSFTYGKRMICGISHWENTFYAVGSWISRGARIYRSADKGKTWTCHYLDTSLITCAVDVCFTSRDTGYITGGYGRQPTLFAHTLVVLKTTDGGLSWRRVFSDDRIGGKVWKIQALSAQVLVGSIEPYYSDTVAMIKSTDGGENWTVLGTGFREYNLMQGTQGIGFITEQHGWLGGYYQGLFETRDGGSTWDSVGFGSNFNRFFVLDSNHVYAGGQTIYFYGGSLPWPPAAHISTAPDLPHKISPVSPNPSTGVIKIEFELLNRTHAKLEVVSIDAKRSWEIAAGWLPAGRYVYYWNGSEAPPGNYLICLGTNEIPIVQKFVLNH